MHSITARPDTALDLITRTAALLEDAAGRALSPAEITALDGMRAVLATVALTAEALTAAGRQRWREGYDAHAAQCARCPAVPSPRAPLYLVAP